MCLPDKYPPETIAELREWLAPLLDDFRCVSQIDLDFSPQSLQLLDNALDEVGRNDRIHKHAKWLYAFSCGVYCGEVFIRNNLHFAWGRKPDMAGEWMLVGPAEWHVFPIDKCVRRLDDEQENLPFFYHAILKMTKAPDRRGTAVGVNGEVQAMNVEEIK